MHEERMSKEAVGRRPNVCLVDDDDIMLSLFSRIIQRSGCDVVTAKGPDAAAMVLASTRVDLVISDLRMPDDSDGEELLRLLHEKYPQMAIAMMSCDFSIEARNTLMAAGATDCISKPLTVDGVSSLIDALDDPALHRETVN